MLYEPSVVICLVPSKRDVKQTMSYTDMEGENVITMNDILGFPPTWAVMMMALDVIFGYANAYLHHEVSSSRMREGFMHKMGYFAIIVLACVAEGALHWCGQLPGFEDAAVLLGVFGVTGASAYVILMEVCSIMEIVGKLNPDIAKSPGFNRMAINQAFSVKQEDKSKEE